MRGEFEGLPIPPDSTSSSTPAIMRLELARPAPQKFATELVEKRLF